MNRNIILVLFLIYFAGYINAEAFPGPAEHIDNIITVTDSGIELDQNIDLKNYYDETFDSYNAYIFEDGFDTRQLRELTITLNGEPITPVINNLAVNARFKDTFQPNETASIKLHFKITNNEFRSNNQILNILGVRLRCGALFGDLVNCYPFDEYIFGSTDVKRGNEIEFVQITKYVNGRLVSSFGNIPLSQCYIYKASDGFSVSTETKEYQKFCTDMPFTEWIGNSVSKPILNEPEKAIIEQKYEAESQISFCIKEQCILGKDDKTDIWFIVVSYQRQMLHKIIFLIILILGIIGLKLAADHSPIEHLLPIFILILTLYVGLFTQPRPSNLTLVDIMALSFLLIGVFIYIKSSKRNKTVDDKMYG